MTGGSVGTVSPLNRSRSSFPFFPTIRWFPAADSSSTDSSAARTISNEVGSLSIRGSNTHLKFGPACTYADCGGGQSGTGILISGRFGGSLGVGMTEADDEVESFDEECNGFGFEGNAGRDIGEPPSIFGEVGRGSGRGESA